MDKGGEIPMSEAIVYYEDLEKEMKTYIHNEDEQNLIHKAYLTALKAHQGQKRKSGEDYIHHPLAVALILAELKSSQNVICAGLLHDVIEDTPITYEDVEAEFGVQIARVVQGVTKLDKMKVQVGEQASANYQNLIFSMIDDVTVIFVKLADRLHNMRTLGAMRPDKQQRIAKETLDILVPIAHRLGIYRVKSELEDLSLRVLDPDRYYHIVEKISEKREIRVEKLAEMTEKLNHILAEHDLRFEVKGRIKNIFSIYKKMYHKGKDFDEIYDLSALRILTDTIPNCYAILGYIHSEFTPLPSRIKDYIAMPKPNGYQSLHTTVLGPDGTIHEIQIRTYAMESIAEYGVAAHWTYKDSVAGMQMNKAKQKEQIQLFQEIKNLMNNTEEETDSSVFIDSLKSDVLSANIYVFTPSGDVISLPTGSTPIDFAYRVHTRVGEKTSGAKVNDRIVPLGYTLKTGDVVEVMTQSNGKPKEAWLRIAKTSSARSKIKQYFKRERRDEFLELGREMVDEVLELKGKSYEDMLQHALLSEIFDKYSTPTIEDLLVAFGNKTVSPTTVVNRLFPDKEQIDLDDIIQQAKNSEKRKKTAQSIVSLGDIGNVSHQFARCCNPIFGDPIMGYISQSKGLVIHRSDCKNLKELDHNRFADVTWSVSENQNRQFPILIQVQSFDRDQLLNDIVQLLYRLKADIRMLNSIVKEDEATVTQLSLSVTGVDQAREIMKQLERIPGVFRVQRVNSFE